MTAQFYRGAQAGVLVFDLTNQASFENLSVWQEALQLEMGDRTIPYILIGNKLDAVDDRQVRCVTQELSKLATSIMNVSRHAELIVK